VSALTNASATNASDTPEYVNYLDSLNLTLDGKSLVVELGVTVPASLAYSLGLFLSLVMSDAPAADIAAAAAVVKDKYPGLADVKGAAIRTATALLEEAGWTVQDGVLKNAAGDPFSFEILITNGANDIIGAATIYVESLKRLGIDARVTTVDSAQYKERTTNYDFQMTHYIRSLSLSPGNEQTLYWGSKGVTEPGTRNWMGMNSPAAEALIANMVAAKNPDEFVASVQALDRVLTSGRYVIPIWYSDVSRIAHRKELNFPERLPLYGDWPGFQPEVWWYQE
jgi:peptide/nickel transport system substrate-binding protein